MHAIHFARTKNLDPNAFKNRQKFAKSPNQNICSQTLSKFARFPESGDKVANMATLWLIFIGDLRYKMSLT